MSEREKDKVNVKMTIKNPNATKDEIYKALSDYFRKYLMDGSQKDIISVFNTTKLI